MIFNCLSRLTGGIILDKVEFKNYFGFIMMLSIFLSFTYSMISYLDYAFALYLGLSYFVSGAVFVSMPIYYARMFGPEVGSQCYAYFFTSNSISYLSFSFVVSHLTGSLGYSGMLMITGITSIIAFVVLLVLPEDPVIYKKESLLYDPYAETIEGPVLHELAGDFA